MSYLTLARFAGDPDTQLRRYAEHEPTMTSVGRDHGLLVHAAARTDAGLLVMNLWPSPDESRAAGEDPRRLGVLRSLAMPPEAITREHHHVDHLVLFTAGGA